MYELQAMNATSYLYAYNEIELMCGSPKLKLLVVNGMYYDILLQHHEVFGLTLQDFNIIDCGNNEIMFPYMEDFEREQHLLNKNKPFICYYKTHIFFMLWHEVMQATVDKAEK